MSCWNTCPRCDKDMEECRCFLSRAKNKIFITIENGKIWDIAATKDLQDVDLVIIDYKGDPNIRCNGELANVTKTKPYSVLKSKEFVLEKL
jgi:hypothetical protein